MSLSKRSLVATVLAMALAGCGGAPRGSVSTMAEVEQARATPTSREAAQLAPQAYAAAEQNRKRSREAYDAGDEVSANLYAEQALTGYQHAVVLGRLARAARDLDHAEAALAASSAEARRLQEARAKVTADGDALDKQLKVLRATIAPPPSGPADPQREAARLTAARSLGTQARLLCGAARLIGPNQPGLADEEKALDALDPQLDAGAKPAPIDAAARARAACLAVLTRARRSSSLPTVGQADALLAELSAAGSWDPVRDERGVVVTLRDAFQGTALTKDADKKLKELGRVLAAHPGHAVQVVVHDATTPSTAEQTADRTRGETAAKVLLEATRPSSSGSEAKPLVTPFAAGARSPLVDPSDARHRGRNARLDVVFVTPGE